MHLGTDPVHRERHQAHALIRIEALDGLHQTDVAFLDQIADLQAVAGIAARDVHDEAQVRQHQLLGRIEIVVPNESACAKILLFLLGQHGNAVNRTHIRLKASDRTGDREVVGDQSIRHFGESPYLGACLALVLWRVLNASKSSLHQSLGRNIIELASIVLLRDRVLEVFKGRESGDRPFP